MAALDLSRSTTGVYLTPEQSNEIWIDVIKQSAVTQLATGVKLPEPESNTTPSANSVRPSGSARPTRSRPTSRPSAPES